MALDSSRAVSSPDSQWLTARDLEAGDTEQVVAIGRAELEIANCAHVAPLILRDGGPIETLAFTGAHGLGARSTPKPSERSSTLLAGDRLLMVSSNMARARQDWEDGLVEAALRSQRGSAADTVREVHRAVIAKRGGELSDDATAVCLSIG